MELICISLVLRECICTRVHVSHALFFPCCCCLIIEIGAWIKFVLRNFIKAADEMLPDSIKYFFRCENIYLLSKPQLSSEGSIFHPQNQALIFCHKPAFVNSHFLPFAFSEVVRNFRLYRNFSDQIFSWSCNVLSVSPGKAAGTLNLGNFFATHKGYTRQGFDRLSTEGSDLEKDDEDATDSENEEYSAPPPPISSS